MSQRLCIHRTEQCAHLPALIPQEEIHRWADSLSRQRAAAIAVLVVQINDAADSCDLKALRRLSRKGDRMTRRMVEIAIAYVEVDAVEAACRVPWIAVQRLFFNSFDYSDSLRNYIAQQRNALNEPSSVIEFPSAIQTEPVSGDPATLLPFPS